MKNKYVKRARISERKFQQLVRLFTAGLEASQIAKLTGLNRKTVNRYLTNKGSAWLNIATHNLPFQVKSKLTSRSSSHRTPLFQQ